MDLTEVARVEKLMASQPGLREEVFTSRELAYCDRHRRAGEHLAGRWAVKEAVLKCLGTGMTPRMEWTDIEVVNDRGGRPWVRLHGEVESVAQDLGMHTIDISLSHSGGFAVAHAVLVCLAHQPGTAPGPRPPTRTTPDTAPRTTPTAEGDDRHEARRPDPAAPPGAVHDRGRPTMRPQLIDRGGRRPVPGTEAPR